MDHLDQVVPPVLVDLVVHQVTQGLQVHLVQVDQAELPVHLEVRDHLDPPDQAVHQVAQELPVHLARVVPQVQVVLVDLLVLQVVLVLLDHLVQVVLVDLLDQAVHPVVLDQVVQVVHPVAPVPLGLPVQVDLLDHLEVRDLQVHPVQAV